MDAHVTTLDYDDGMQVLIHPATKEAVKTIMEAPLETGDGRSEWMFLRLPNGDLFLGVFPQGDTYLAVEADAEYRGPRDDPMWCEQCGERPIAVHATDAGLCTKCAADTIDQLSKEVAR